MGEAWAPGAGIGTPRSVEGGVQVPRRLGEGTGSKGTVNGEAPLRLTHEAGSYLP